jgi:hypothetical protein
MKESLTKIENRLKKFLSIKVSFKRMNPHVYWRNLLYVFFILILILILFSFYLLYQIKNQQIFQITPQSKEQLSLMNEKLYDKIAESFKNKKIKEKEIENGLTLYKDPSLN